MTQAAGELDLTNEPVRPPSASRRFVEEIGRALWTPVRLFIRHWPVLFALAVAGVFLREALIWLSIRAAGVNNVLGFLVFLLAPVAVIVALVLMLRSVRSSLPSVREAVGRSSTLRDLGNVLIPFVAFYAALDMFQEDYRGYDEGLRDKYESVGAFLSGTDRDDVRLWGIDEGGNLVPLLSVVVVAFLLRWALDRWELTKRTPALGIPGAYLESVWVVLGVLWVFNPLVNRAEAWAGERVAWHAVLDWWHGLVAMTGGLGPVFRTIDDWLVLAFPSGGFSRIFIMPLTGLVAAAVVYNLEVSATLRPLPGLGRRRFVRWAVGGVILAISRRFGPLIGAVRAMVRSGSVPLMIFCLSAVALQTLGQWLTKGERALLGPSDPASVQSGLSDSLDAFNDVLMFMALVCVLAAAADGVARRTDRPASVQREPDVAGEGRGDGDPDNVGVGAGR